MIVVTGARGFIGSNLVEKLNQENITDIVLVDELENEAKERNISNLKFAKKIHRNDFLQWFSSHAKEVKFVFHLGARTDTTETDKSIFNKLNLHYSKSLWTICSKEGIPFIYASSAATYGNGKLAYNDTKDISLLQPLNEYGWSKQNFDLWTQHQTKTPPYFIGLKFFNVYGPNEYHKSRMASVVFHAYNKIRKTKKMELFQSHKKEYKNGEQMRDFIYVKDIIKVCIFLYKNKIESGIYNLGTGQARSFNDLAKAVFNTLEIKEDISYIPTPKDIRDKYQYFTEAKMDKLIDQGYTQHFYSLEEGIDDYVKKHLKTLKK